ncbi:MAG: TAXI family TRAP transporter solute-binding subunit [Bacillota bacterium]
MNLKKIAGLTALLMVLAAALAGCGGGGKTQEKPAQPAAKAKELLFATGGTAGTYYPLGGAISQIWNEKVKGVHVTVQATGASVENMRLLGKKEADLALAMNNIAEDAYKGQGSFKEAIKNFKAVGVVYPEVVQAFVGADSDIKNIAGLKGKKVAVGPTGSGTAVTTEIILKAYGLTYKDIQPIFATFADAVDQFKDKHIDSAWNVLAVPASAIQDVVTVRKIRFLDIEGPELEKLLKEQPLFSKYEIPANSYQGQDKPVKTVTLQSVLYVREDLDENLVYELTKTLYEQKDAIGQIHNAGKQIDLKRAVDGVTTPIHPGALKYYQEKGIKVG